MTLEHGHREHARHPHQNGPPCLPRRPTLPTVFFYHNSYQPTNLLSHSFPRIHFPLAPIISAAKATQERNSVNKLTMSYFEPGNQMIKRDPRDGKFMACCLVFCSDAVPNNILASIRRTRRTVQFSDRCPTGLKLSCCWTCVPGGGLNRVHIISK
jgi:tubulin alpha